MKNKSLQEVRILSGECFTTTLDKSLSLYTPSLYGEIAIGFWSPDLNLAILGRCLTKSKIAQIIKTIKLDCHGQNIHVQAVIVGGDDSPEVARYVQEVVQTINELDYGSSIFDVNVLAGDMIHPDFCILHTDMGFGAG